MYFRNKFNEEFLYLANEISPKGGSVSLSTTYPQYFIIERPAFDEAGTYIIVKPLLLYNTIKSTNQRDKNIDDWIMLCQNKKDTIVSCTYDKYYESEQGYIEPCVGAININADLVDEEYDEYYKVYDYDYEEV